MRSVTRDLGFRQRSCYPDEQNAAFRRFFNSKGLIADEKLWAAYIRWRHYNQNADFERFYQNYQEERRAVKAVVDAMPSPFINAKKGEPYKVVVRMPPEIDKYKFFGLEEIGLIAQIDAERPHDCVISGIPLAPGNFTLRLLYVWKGWLHRDKPMDRQFNLLVNPDPRELWEDRPTDPGLEYARSNLAFSELECDVAHLWAASRRGRSHAHEGKPRDDSFSLGCFDGWQMLAVADGAGSAEFSRKGAEIACETALASCKENLRANGELEKIFLEVDSDVPPVSWKGAASKLAYHILPAAAFAAHKAIRQEAEITGREMRSYATTLLIALTKRFPGGWAVLSFQVGDGAMGMFSGDKAELLAEPDEGEYGGQTRFITMNEIFDSSHELMRRLRVDFVSDLRAILLMTDGVSDALLQTPQGLNDNNQWEKLRQDLLIAARDVDPETALLDWLNFWSRGNHDDRTVALLEVENQ